MSPRSLRVCAIVLTLVLCARAAPAEPAAENVTADRAADNSKENLIRDEGQETERPPHERHPHAVLFGGTCGGSIISDTWILTAAHCTIFTSGRYILAGTNNSEDGSGVSVPVKRLIVHPRFSVGPYWLNAVSFGLKQVGARFDFMLAELTRPLPLNGVNISAVTLDEHPSLPADLQVSYAGYGAEHHGEVMRRAMHSMELALVDDETCSSKLAEYDRQDMVCAKGRPPRFDSACDGDSGSGLVGDGRLVGVVSWVEDDALTCEPGKIVVFSRVSVAREWIRSVTGI